MRVVGIDPGTSSWDIFGYDVETNEICIDTSIETKIIMENPDLLFASLEKIEPFDCMIAPSGFGLPMKKIQEIMMKIYIIWHLTLKNRHKLSD